MNKESLELKIETIKSQLESLSSLLREREAELAELDKSEAKKWLHSQGGYVFCADDQKEMLNVWVPAAHEAGQKYGAKKEAEKYVHALIRASSIFPHTTELQVSVSGCYEFENNERILISLPCRDGE